MKKQYLISKSELVKIETPKNYNDLIGKYYLYKLKNGKNCFYRITNIEHRKKADFLRLYTFFEGMIKYRGFCTILKDFPSFYELKTIDTKILFNVFEEE